MKIEIFASLTVSKPIKLMTWFWSISQCSVFLVMNLLSLGKTYLHFCFLPSCCFSSDSLDLLFSMLKDWSSLWQFNLIFTQHSDIGNLSDTEGLCNFCIPMNSHLCISVSLFQSSPLNILANCLLLCPCGYLLSATPTISDLKCLSCYWSYSAHFYSSDWHTSWLSQIF